MTRLRRLWTTGLMTSALILGSALLAQAQAPPAGQGEATSEQLLLAYLHDHEDGLFVAGPPRTNGPGLATSDLSRLLPPRWSTDRAVHLLRISFQARATPRISSGTEAHGQVFRVQKLPYPNGILAVPTFPGHASTPTSFAQQYGYTLFTWTPGRGLHH